jgi:aspartate oxidase
MIVTKTLVGAATTTSVATGIISDATQYGDPEDSFEKHCEDTLADGAGVNDKALAKTMANDASKYFSKLIELGVEFDVESGPRQVFIPGHSKPRSDYMKDKGVMLQKALAKAIILATGGPGEMYSRIPLMLRVAQMRVS